MTVFVLTAAALTLAAVLVVVFGPRLQRRGADVSRTAVNAQALRQQLAELERERARGLLDETGFARAHEELRQRLMSEMAPDEPAVSAPRGAARPVLFAVAVALPLAAVALYLQFGQPQLVGVPQTAVLGASVETAAAGDQLLPQLEARVAAAPNDGRAWVLLARARMQRDRFEPAATAYARALEVSAKVARDPQIWCEYADALGMAAGGRLDGRPSQLIDKALALDPQHPRALEMAGSAAYGANDFRGATRHWQQLLAQLPAGSAEHAQLAAAVARAERRAQSTLPAS